MNNHYYKVEFFRVSGFGVVSTITFYQKVVERNKRVAFETVRFGCERHELVGSGWGYGITVIEACEYMEAVHHAGGCV